jgi:hypothetical protein
VQRLLGLHVGGRVGDLGGLLLALGLEVRDEELQRVLAAVEDQVVGQRALGLGDLAVRRDVVGVDHREVEPRLHAVVQEDRVEHRARRGETPKETLETPSEVLTCGSACLSGGCPRSSRPPTAATPRRRWSA